MEKAIVRIDDTSDHGGKMVSASGRFTLDGKMVCVEGDLHQCPIRYHGTTPVHATQGAATTGGKAILRVGDKAECGATITQGSLDAGTGT
jgi:uncharacterized Zn-binding protein involved in type VI secretion